MAWKRAVCYARKTHNNSQRRTTRSCQSLPSGYIKKPGHHHRREMSEHELSNAIYTFTLNRWESLSSDEIAYLGFDPTPGSEGERRGLNFLAELFRDFSEASFERALDARQRRLNIGRFQGDSDADTDAKDR